MSVNDNQVGGKHYYSGYIHWDFVIDTGMGYFDGNASKYVSRWRKKGGVEDLRKAAHYIEKMLERVRLVPKWIGNNARLAEDFAKINELNSTETDIMVLLCTWRNAEDLLRARRLIAQLIVHTPPLDQMLPEPKPVPLTEENKHAQREGEDDQSYLQFPTRLIEPIESEETGKGTQGSGA